MADDSSPPVDDAEDRELPERVEPPETVLYRWTCPYCGEFGIQSATPADVERYVVNALRSHVRSTDGDGHGPKRKLPEDVERSLREHVRILASGADVDARSGRDAPEDADSPDGKRN